MFCCRSSDGLWQSRPISKIFSPSELFRLGVWHSTWSEKLSEVVLVVAGNRLAHGGVTHFECFGRRFRRRRDIVSMLMY